jgi:hypothetical protein
MTGTTPHTALPQLTQNEAELAPTIVADAQQEGDFARTAAVAAAVAAALAAVLCREAKALQIED